MQQISESLALLDTVNFVRENVIFSIKETLKSQNLTEINLSNSITNQFVDEVDNQQIVSVDAESETVTIEHGDNEYDISFKNIRVEILIEILQAIEAEEYTDALADDEE